ncbi:hypothetical protein [Dyella tabacisoli]|uniref:Uncharacterized protein n=1 Tax=Dyella tabacisoli TaxID=2282381 RepID=A0A369URC6_9GAMM|nr:hypothetical protein [Dyella tabacisoli]RDD83071.1 hypothetical protein DVJ77_00130 [Dyella tabacisoli]
MGDTARAAPGPSATADRPPLRTHAEPSPENPQAQSEPVQVQQAAGNQSLQRLHQDATPTPPPDSTPAAAGAAPANAAPANVDHDNSAMPAAAQPDAAAAGTAAPDAAPGAAAPGPASPAGAHPAAAGAAAPAATGGAARPGAAGAAHPAAGGGGAAGARGAAHAPAGAAAGGGPAGGGDAATAGSGLDSADTGDLALIDEELAEHQRWSSASVRVGAAESTQRAAFIAEQAGAGFTEGAGSGLLMGLGMGAGTRVALKVADVAVRRFGGRIAGNAAKFTPIPAVGAIIGGAMSAYGLATRNWADTGKKIGRIGQGASTYEKIANTIDAISEVIDVTTNILNVIAGVCGAIAVGLWVAAVVTVGVLSPLAGILTEVALAIGAATMILDGINAGVLHPVSLAFRALHEFTSDADPTQVEADGAELSSAAGAAGGALGAYAGGKMAHIGARPPSGHLEPDPHPDHPNPSAHAGEGPTVTATPPIDEHALPGGTTEHAPEPVPGAADHPATPPHETDPHATAPPVDPNAPGYRISDEANVPPAAAAPPSAPAPVSDQAPLPGVVDRNYGRGSPPPGVTPPPGTPVPGQPERAFIPNQPELNRPWMYDERVPNRGDLGHNVQRDHVISQQKIRDQMVDPHGVLRTPDLDSLTVLAETGKATATSPAKPHTQATFIDPQADVPEIHRLRDLDRPANWTTDIVEPSRDARLRAGYDPAAVDTVILDQMGRLHEQYRNHEINDALKTLAAAEAKTGRPAGVDTDIASLHNQLDQAFPDGPSSPPPTATGAAAPATTPAAPPPTAAVTSAPVAPPAAGHPAEPANLVPDHVDTAASVDAPSGAGSMAPGDRVRIASNEPPVHDRDVLAEREHEALVEHERDTAAARRTMYVDDPTTPSGRTMRVSESTRSSTPLTPEQKAEVRHRMSTQMGIPPEIIQFSDTSPTAFLPGFDMFIIGPDLNPLPVASRPTGLRNPANAALEAQAAMGHEAIGHREAWLAGQTRDDVWHEELQASARAALHTPDLPHDQSQLLMQDAAARRPAGHTETIYVFTDRVGPDGKPLPEPRGPGSAGSGGTGTTPAVGTRPQDVLPKVMIDPSIMGPAPADHAATPVTPSARTPATPVAAAPGGTAATPAVVAPRLPPALAAPHPAAPAPDSPAAPPKGNAFMRGLREGLEPIVTHVNPAYTPPPVTPQQIIDIQNEILCLLAARAEAENEAARMATERSHHQAQQAPLARAHREMSGAQTAVSAHSAAVQRRQQANEAQQQRTRESGATLAGAPNQLAGLSVITIPLGLFLGLTQYAHLLPEGDVRSGMMKMDGDSRKLLASFDEMGQSVDTQNAATPARQQAVAADAGRLGSTSQQATPTRQGFVRAASGAQALQQANSERIARAGAAHAQATGQAQVMGNDAAQREATVQTLSQTLQTWAQAHKAQRQAALQTTAARIEAQGGHVIQRSEG